MYEIAIGLCALLAALYFFNRPSACGHRCVVIFENHYNLYLLPGIGIKEVLAKFNAALQNGFAQSSLTDDLFDDTPFLDGDVHVGLFVEEGEALLNEQPDGAMFVAHTVVDPDVGRVAQIYLNAPTTSQDTHNGHLVMEIFLDAERQDLPLKKRD